VAILSRNAAGGGVPILEIEDLVVAFPGRPPVVDGVSLAVGRGEIVGLVGESGSGKSLTALAVLGLLPPPARAAAGRIWLGGHHAGNAGPAGRVDLLTLPAREMRRVRGRRVGMVFQEPAAALDPVYTIGFQVAEAVRAHRPVSRREASAEAVRLLDRMALPDARRRLGDYPHQLSGGQRQRVMIAMALAGGPDLLLADEPTTALDVTLQAQILELLRDLRADLGLSVLLITHDLGVVAETCDRVVVMRAGRVLEEAEVGALFRAPAHPYTRELLAAVPRLEPSPPRPSSPAPSHPPSPGEEGERQEASGLEAPSLPVRGGGRGRERGGWGSEGPGGGA
jgi:ABC-type dipeptide/oligopeptide/nickel transport system ATPase component